MILGHIYILQFFVIFFLINCKRNCHNIYKFYNRRFHLDYLGNLRSQVDF